MGLLSTLRTGVLWLTRPAQMHCRDPRYGLAIGLARTIRTELSLDFATMELQTLDSAAAEAVLTVFHKFQRQRSVHSSDFSFEPEFAVHDGIVHVPRYRWLSISKELEAVGSDGDPKHVTVGLQGLIYSVHWIQHDRPATLDADEVEMEVRHVGLNFRVCPP